HPLRSRPFQSRRDPDQTPRRAADRLTSRRAPAALNISGSLINPELPYFPPGGEFFRYLAPAPKITSFLIARRALSWSRRINTLHAPALDGFWCTISGRGLTQGNPLNNGK